MGLLDRIRAWFGGLFGTEETEPESTASEEGPRLDPENVTEVRKQVEEDPAAKLEDVRETRADGEEPDEGT